MTALAIVDYDNFKGREHEHKSEYNFEILFGKIESAVAKFNAQIHSDEIVVRIYGGWINSNGEYTDLGIHALRYQNLLRKRINGKRVRPEIAIKMISCNDVMIGMYNEKQKCQKMVDAMMNIDIMHSCSSDYAEVGIFSKDQDLLPGILQAANSFGNKLYLCSDIDAYPNQLLQALITLGVTPLRKV